jgi:hypothetical protein
MTTEEIFGMFTAGLIVGFLLEITAPDSTQLLMSRLNRTNCNSCKN